MPGEESSPPLGRWWVLAPVMSGTFMGGLDTYIVNVSLPTIANTLRAEVAVIQWVSLAYLVAITSSLVLFGRASDLWGSRRVYMGGLLTFVLGSALAGAAPSAVALVVCRGMQGLGAAMLLASGQALIAEIFPEGQRGRAMASNMFLISFFLQDQLLLSPSRAGLLMIAVPLTILWAAPVGGWLSDRLGPRVPATVGLLLVTATVVLMAVLSGGTSSLTMAVVLGVYGLGAGLFQSPNNSGVLGAAPRERLGVASGTLATMRQMGQVAGIAIASMVWVAREQAYLATGLPGLVAQGAGFRDAFLVLAVAGLLAVVASALRGRSAHGRPRPAGDLHPVPERSLRHRRPLPSASTATGSPAIWHGGP